MSSAVSSIFFLLLVKHCIIDLWLQSLLTYKEKKSVYTSLSAQVHYLQHGFGTLFVLLFFVPWQYAIAIGLFDYIAHWNIDHLKSRTQKKFNIKSPEKAYWFLSSIDQGLHYLTYYLIILYIT